MIVINDLDLGMELDREALSVLAGGGTAWKKHYGKHYRYARKYYREYGYLPKPYYFKPVNYYYVQTYYAPKHYGYGYGGYC